MQLLPKWVLPPTMPAIYDLESSTSLEMVAKVYGAMNTLIEEYNQFADSVNNKVETFTESEKEAREEFETNATTVYRQFVCQMETYLKLNLGDTATKVIMEGMKDGSIPIPTDSFLSKANYPADAAATGEAIAVERARINSLSKLSEGSTTGDAELQDIRTGYDGTEYETAGEAVRKQFSAIWNDALTAGGSLAGSSGPTGGSYPEFPYTNCNDFPAGTVYGVNNAQSWLANTPYDGFVGQIVTLHFGKGSHNTGSGRLQLAFSMTGVKKILMRGDFGNKGNFTPWDVVGCNEIYNLKSTNLQIVSADQGYASYNDLPANSLVLVTAGILTDEPYTNAQGVVLTANYTPIVKGGAFQLFMGTKNRFYFRMGWNTPIQWERWEAISHSGNDIPKLITSFYKVGTIGDSLCAGTSSYIDGDGNVAYTQSNYPHSWPAFMGKHFSVDIVNCSRGGATTRSFLTNPHGYAKAATPGNECNAYIIGLGRNDKNQIGADYLGSVSDINVSDHTKNADTYYGNYAKIICLLKEIRPNAKFFLIKDPMRDSAEEFNAAIDTIAGLFDNCYVIDLSHKAYMYNSGGYYHKNMRNTHYNSVAYNHMGQMIGMEISRYMYDNPEEFLYVEFTENE